MSASHLLAAARDKAVSHGLRPTALLLSALAFSGICLAQVQIFKMGGEIDVSSAPKGASLKTLGGSIRLDTVSGPAVLQTNGGDINIGCASGSVDATTLGGNITVRLCDGSGDSSRIIHLKSNAGNISLYLPPQFSMTLDVNLAHTKNQSRHFEIIADYPQLKREEDDSWDYLAGTPRKYLTAKGTIGSGKNQVVIETINGDVTIRQQSTAPAPHTP